MDKLQKFEDLEEKKKNYVLEDMKSKKEKELQNEKERKMRKDNLQMIVEKRRKEKSFLLLYFSPFAVSMPAAPTSPSRSAASSRILYF